jgi:hypothetical protein
MMQAFNKKVNDLQKDLEKVKRNQAGKQRKTRISDIKKDTECSLLEVLSPKYARYVLLKPLLLICPSMEF